jgi:zona occludens toxin (predicted ATPase)
MAVTMFDGPPGSGKSLLATYLGIEALLEHKNVIANYPFNMNYFRRKKRIGKFQYVKTADLSPEIFVRWAIENHRRSGRWAKKCQTIVIVDEAEMIFNSRDWDKSNRMDWINFLANHRHFNFDIYLICPLDRMLDRQIRGVVTSEYKCRAITAFGFIGKAISLLFGGLFCAVPFNYTSHVKLFPPHFFRLHKRKANVYDTMRMFEGMAGYQQMEGEEKNVPAEADKKEDRKAKLVAACHGAATMLHDFIFVLLRKACKG